jgi:molecular chaperone GrpE
MSTPENQEPEVPEVHAEVVATEPKTEGEVQVAEETAHPKSEPPPPDLRDLRIQSLERALADREATLHAYIRAHKKQEAEFDAFRQRLERDREREVDATRGRVLEKLLDIDENLERTVAALDLPQATFEGLAAGARMIRKQFLERLNELGLERVDPVGFDFDPTWMEALGVVAVNDPAMDGQVAITLRAGYRHADRELRPALVQIGKFFS